MSDGDALVDELLRVCGKPVAGHTLTKGALEIAVREGRVLELYYWSTMGDGEASFSFCTSWSVTSTNEIAPHYIVFPTPIPERLRAERGSGYESMDEVFGAFGIFSSPVPASRPAPALEAARTLLASGSTGDAAVNAQLLGCLDELARAIEGSLLAWIAAPFALACRRAAFDHAAPPDVTPTDKPTGTVDGNAAEIASAALTRARAVLEQHAGWADDIDARNTAVALWRAADLVGRSLTRLHVASMGLETLLAAVTAAPDDMAPRVAYATAIREVEPERAELIDVQLRLREAARRHVAPAAADRERAEALLRQHGGRWAGPLLRSVTAYEYHAGFVDQVTLPASELRGCVRALVHDTPVRHLRLTAPGGWLADVAALPELARIASLDLSNGNVTDDDLVALAQSPHVGRLRLLDLRSCKLSARALHALAASAALQELAYVDLGGTGLAVLDVGTDYDGSVIHAQQTPLGQELGAKHGRLPWLVATSAPPLDDL